MLPLRPDDLKIGNLYSCIWLTVTNVAMSNIWLEAKQKHPNSHGFVAGLNCFVLLDTNQDSTEMTWRCKILTSEGKIGWTTFSTGTHWFKELTTENNI